MKKSILAVAGVAALAGVVVPFAGVSAADPSDTISVTISSSCSLSYDQTAHSAGTSGTWSSDKVSVTIANGAKDTNIGSTNLKVVCNNAKGYDVALSASSNLTGTTSSSNTIAYAASEPGTTTSSWGVKNGTTWVASDATIKSETTTTAGTQFSVTYGAGISSTQAADTYEGTAAYTLTPKSS